MRPSSSPPKRELKGVKTFAKFDFERVAIKVAVGSGMKEDKWVGVEPCPRPA